LSRRSQCDGGSRPARSPLTRASATKQEPRSDRLSQLPRRHERDFPRVKLRRCRARYVLVAPSGSASRRITCSRRSTKEKPSDLEGFRDKRLMGLEPTTFCMASRRSSQLSYSRAERPV
jgi:hypothetical protein